MFGCVRQRRSKEITNNIEPEICRLYKSKKHLELNESKTKHYK
jgi:hypothetical protein